MTQEAMAVRYEYSTYDSKKVQDIERVCNEKAADGRELVQALAVKDRYVSIFRRTRT
jgi:hypothetical protein